MSNNRKTVRPTAAEASPHLFTPAARTALQTRASEDAAFGEDVPALGQRVHRVADYLNSLFDALHGLESRLGPVLAGNGPTVAKDDFEIPPPSCPLDADLGTAEMGAIRALEFTYRLRDRIAL